MVLYYDAVARADRRRLNYTDLVTACPGFVWPESGMILWPLAAEGPGRWRVLPPLRVLETIEGADAIDVYAEDANVRTPETLEVGDARLGGWSPEVSVYPRAVPAAVEEALTRDNLHPGA